MTADLIVKRRFVDMQHAAIAYAITRISEFTNAGLDLTPAERAALRTLVDNDGGADE